MWQYDDAFGSTAYVCLEKTKTKKMRKLFRLRSGNERTPRGKHTAIAYAVYKVNKLAVPHFEGEWL